MHCGYSKEAAKMQPVISDYNFRKPKIGKAGLKKSVITAVWKEPQRLSQPNAAYVQKFTGYSWKNLEHTVHSTETGLSLWQR